MNYPVHGVGLGLRRSLLPALQLELPPQLDFLECAPENWIGVGGALGRKFRAVTECLPLVCHGLSLNLGGPAPLDEVFIRQVKAFLDVHQVRCYSDHLSYCADNGQLYDLMPIPYSEEAVAYVAARIERVQELLERRLAIENVSYYCAPGQTMTEIAFITAVLETADCDLLLDINNIYVNSVNHGYDASAYLCQLPAERIAYAHIAGHYREAPDLIIDTHGAEVIDPVWQLLQQAYSRFGVFPTLLERDFNIPPLPELLLEINQIASLQRMAEVSLHRVAIA